MVSLHLEEEKIEILLQLLRCITEGYTYISHLKMDYNVVFLTLEQKKDRALIECENGNDDPVREFLSNPFGDNKHCISTKYILSLAVIYNEIEFVRILLNRPEIDINFAEKNKYTPLMYGCLNGSLDSVSLLLRKGADTELQDEKGMTALFIAVKAPKGIVHELLYNGANINHQDNGGITPLIYSAITREYGLSKTFIRRGANPYLLQDNEGRTFLDYFCSSYEHRIRRKEMERCIEDYYVNGINIKGSDK